MIRNILLVTKFPTQHQRHHRRHDTVFYHRHYSQTPDNHLQNTHTPNPKFKTIRFQKISNLHRPRAIVQLAREHHLFGRPRGTATPLRHMSIPFYYIIFEKKSCSSLNLPLAPGRGSKRREIRRLLKWRALLSNERAAILCCGMFRFSEEENLRWLY